MFAAAALASSGVASPVDQGTALLVMFAFTGLLTAGIVVLAVGLGLLRWKGVLLGTRQPERNEAPIRWALFGIGLFVWFFAQLAAVGIVVAFVGGVEEMQEAIQEIRYLLAVSVGPWLVIIPVVALAGVLLPLKPWHRLGWKPIGFAHGALSVPMIIPVVLFVTMGTQLVRYHLGASLDESHPLLAGLETDWLLVAGMFLGVGLLVPIAEEIAFRGLLQGALGAGLTRLADPMKEAGMRWLAILISSLVFAVIHPFFSWPAIFTLSILLGYAYDRSGSIWTPIVGHAAFNTFNLSLAVLLLYADVPA
ncbi:MAG: CPBP family intramembrane glutamic endopeptidase [Planctomycetota bacterium]